MEEYILTKEDIENNKKTFIELINGIEREEFNKEALLKKLENSDFYHAPASAKYHGSYEGGLVDHSLSVYYNLKRMVENKGLKEVYNDETLRIVALFHDFSKMNFYEKSFMNKKIYNENGSKWDDLGKYDWKSIPTYIVKEDRFVYGNSAVTSEFMIRQYMDLKVEESISIIHSNGAFDKDNTGEISNVFEKYNLACLLHLADMMSTFVDRV